MARLAIIVAGALVAVAVAGALISRSDTPEEGGVYAVAQGMTHAEVRALAGAPQRQREDCWLYRGRGVGVRVCFTEQRLCYAGVCSTARRVSEVEITSESRSRS